MSAFDTYSNSINIGALSNATRPLFHAPSDPLGGGITVVAADAVQGGSTNSGLILVKGTVSASGVFTANGTISSAGIGGTAVPFAANATQAFTIGSGNFVDAGEWVAVTETNVAAANTVAIVVVAYQMGR